MRQAVLARKSAVEPAATTQAAKAESRGFRVSEPNDVFEQEAECVADEIMAGGSSKMGWSLARLPIDAPLQRKCACGGSGGAEGECEECKKKKETLQRRAASPATPTVIPPIVHEVLRSQGQPLDTATRAFFEPRFGHDFSSVRVHTDARAAASAVAVSALAYTVGNDIVFGTRRYAPEWISGRRLLAHELAHVVQQEKGAPSIHGSAGCFVSATNHPAEIGADRAAAQVVGGGRAHVAQTTPAHLQRTASPQDEQKKAEAKRSHEEEQQNIVGLIAQMRTIKSDPSKGFEDPDNLLHNALEWLPEAGQASSSRPQAKLTILSPTHEPDSRDPKRGRAFFDSRVQYPNIGGDYPADPAIKTADGLVYRPLPAQAETTFDEVEIFTDSFFDFEVLRKVLVHELQHVADQSGMTTLRTFGMPSSDLLAAEEHYKTEFRAFWIQPPPPKAAGAPPASQTFGQLQLPHTGPFVPPVTEDFGSSQDPASNADPVSVSDPSTCKVCAMGKQSVPTKFKNRKQEKIFWYLVKKYTFRQFDCFYVCSTEFQKLVNDLFVFPEGVNLANSVRIETLSRAVQASHSQMTEVDPAIRQVFVAARGLDAIDRQFLQVEEQSGPFWRQVRAHIPGALLDTITNLIKTGKTSPESPGDYELPGGNARMV
jgi:hypothetical protein